MYLWLIVFFAGFIRHEQERIPTTAEMEAYENQTVSWSVLIRSKIAHPNYIAVEFFFYVCVMCACGLKKMYCLCNLVFFYCEFLFITF